jgi:hypothetical protein
MDGRAGGRAFLGPVVVAEARAVGRLPWCWWKGEDLMQQQQENREVWLGRICFLFFLSIVAKLMLPEQFYFLLWVYIFVYTKQRPSILNKSGLAISYLCCGGSGLGPAALAS